MLVEITDPTQAMQLYRAGLLLERRAWYPECEVEIAHGWFDDDKQSGIVENIALGDECIYKFYVQLED